MSDSFPAGVKLTPESLRAFISTHTAATRFWIGYSGGVDSHVLLDLALKTFTTCEVGAVHVHHGLSPNADRWAKHCEEVCAGYNVPFSVLVVNAQVKDGESPEEVAREARFTAFEKFMQPDEALLLAHHQEDQAETILLRLFRGAGPLGLGGMSYKSRVGSGDLLRPLLGISRREIEQYGTEHQLSWIEDESNQNQRFDRNFLRHEILPRLQARWPRVVRSVSRAGSLCLETATAVQVISLEDLKHSKTKEGGISVSALLRLEPSRRRGVLRCWLQEQGMQVPSWDQLERIDREVLMAQPDRKPRVKVGEYEVSREGGELRVEAFCNEILR